MYKPVVLIGLLFINLLGFPAAQAQALRVTELNDSTEDLDITGKVMHLKNSTASYQIGHILEQVDEDQWEPTRQGYVNLKLFSDAEWFKIRVMSTGGKDWYLDIDNPVADSVFVYTISDGVVRNWKGGDRIGLKDEPLATGSLFIPLNLNPGKITDIYIRVSAKDLTRLPMRISTLAAKADSQATQNLLYGVFFGWLAIMILYNFFVFYTTREKAYLFYCLYNAGIGLLIAALEGYGFRYLWTGSLYLEEIMPPFLSSMASVGSLLFVRYFLITREKVPLLDAVLSFLIFCNLVALGILFAGQTFVSNVMVQSIAMAGSITIIASAFIVLRQGYRPALFFTQGYLVAQFGIIIYILGNLEVLPNLNWVIASIPVSTSIEVALLSLALADRLRYSKLQEEKARLLASRARQQANEELEKTIKERTYQISRQNQILGIHRKALEQQKQEIEKERRKADALLLNILPLKVAVELKEQGHTSAEVFPDVSVLFTDIVNFTQTSEKLGPENLVKELDQYFRLFDGIMDKYGLEKIKTIGDAYLAVAGMKDQTSDHAERAIRAALELVSVSEKLASQGHFFRIRAGIHSGTVVGGVVGINKFAFDIWGDTVNTAARMEQNSMVAEVNVSGTTYEKARDAFEFEYRGKIEAKHKGQLDMYFARLRPEIDNSQLDSQGTV